jgi:hypothetical protein
MGLVKLLTVCRICSAQVCVMSTMPISLRVVMSLKASSIALALVSARTLAHLGIARGGGAKTQAKAHWSQR